jgi:hypothetical protein
MTALNVFESCKVALPREFALEVTCPVVPDGRMLPFEWVITAEGAFVKAHGAEHGGDHFFPGPTDIAWDRVGAIVEWNLDVAERNALFCRFAALAGDHVARRVDAYVIAYKAFRLSVVTFAEADSNAEEATTLSSRVRALSPTLVQRARCDRVPSATFGLAVAERVWRTLAGSECTSNYTVWTAYVGREPSRYVPCLGVANERHDTRGLAWELT